MFSYLGFTYVGVSLFLLLCLGMETRKHLQLSLQRSKATETPQVQFVPLNDRSLPDSNLEQLVAAVVVPGRIPKSITYVQYPEIHELHLIVHSSDTIHVHTECFRFKRQSKTWWRNELSQNTETEYRKVDKSLLEPLYSILYELPLRNQRCSVSFA